MDEAGDDSEDERYDTDEIFRTNTHYLWTLLFATTAECLTTCYVPEWTIGTSKLNASATALNFIGPFMDGISYTFEEIPKIHKMSLPCLDFREAFLGVFTSYSFMVDHAGDLSTDHVFLGPQYICCTILFACGSFKLGKLFAQTYLIGPDAFHMFDFTHIKLYPSFLFYLLGFNLCTVIRATFGPIGFVRDPQDPQFVGNIKVEDGEELILGIFMSCTAILMGEYICEQINKQTKKNNHMLPKIDWGIFICNFLSVVLTWIAYEASKLSPTSMQNNLLVLKFVSSFCGSISCFSAAISQIMLHWNAGDKHSASWNLLLHLILGLVFVPYLNKKEYA